VLRVLDLFSGIGGFALGLQRAGMETIAFSEIDPYCCRVLARHWPDIPNLGDVRRISLVQLCMLGRIDVICGGFPCQDLSVAGSGLGLDGPRSGLWTEFARLIRLVRPRYVILENVTGLLARGLGRILGELATLGYDAQWHCIPAAHIGAPHRRDRVWIVAYTHSDALRDNQQWAAWGRDILQHGRHAQPGHDGSAQPLADTDSGRREGFRLAQHAAQSSAFRNQLDGCSPPGFRAGATLPESERERLEAREQAGSAAASARRPGVGDYRGWWESEPAVGRVAHGIPDRVERLRGLGNAVVPQVVELIGRALIAAARPLLWCV